MYVVRKKTMYTTYKHFLLVWSFCFFSRPLPPLSHPIPSHSMAVFVFVVVVVVGDSTVERPNVYTTRRFVKHA